LPQGEPVAPEDRERRQREQADALPEDVKRHLDSLSLKRRNRLDVTSDEHMYVWGFRQDRPDEIHAEHLAALTPEVPRWHERLGQKGHDMAWELEDNGVGTAPACYGTCRNCGAGIGVSAVSIGGGRDSFQCAKDVPCRGPGTAWQDGMQQELARERLNGAVAQFGQEVKDNYDRAWLKEQGLA
jgi:hypothetical protein